MLAGWFYKCSYPHLYCYLTKKKEAKKKSSNSSNDYINTFKANLKVLPIKNRERHCGEEAGGTLVLTGDKNWYGVGHNAVANFDGTDYLIFHGYDAADNGKPKLRIEKLQWVDGWPVVQ